MREDVFVVCLIYRTEKGKENTKPSCRLQERETNRATRSASSLAPLRRNYRRLGMSRKSFRLLIWKGGEKKSSFAVWSDVCLCSLITFSPESVCVPAKMVREINMSLVSQCRRFSFIPRFALLNRAQNEFCARRGDHQGPVV